MKLELKFSIFPKLFFYQYTIAILGETCQVIELLFQRLDHICCKDNTDDWRLLYVMVKCYRKHPSSTEWSKIGECASERKSWWPRYHFASFSMTSFEGVKGSGQNGAKLSKYKRKVSLYLKFKGILHLQIVIITILFWVFIIYSLNYLPIGLCSKQLQIHKNNYI